MPNYAINGFGRIGRNVLRAMSQKQVERVVAINDLTDTHTLAHLLKWDSVHGKFDGEIGYDDENIIVRGHKIKVLKERDPANLPWKKLDVDVVLESTGLFTSREKADLHRRERQRFRRREAQNCIERELHNELSRAHGKNLE